MKKTFFILAIFILHCSNLSAQSRSISGIFSKLAKLVDMVESDGKEIVRMEADLIQTEKTTYRNLQEGWTYGIIAVGSDRIQDLDIEVYKLIDNDWTMISKDNDKSSAAVVNIKPSSSGQYKIVVKAFQFYPGYDIGHYGLLVFHE